MKFKLRSQTGASATEFAIILPLLVIIIFGIIEFGFILYDKALVTNASREGARAGIVARYTIVGASSVYSPMTETGIQGIVRDYLGGTGNFLTSLGDATAPQETTTATWNPSFPTMTGSGAYLTVTVTYPYTFLVLPNFVTALTGQISIGATTTMRME